MSAKQDKTPIKPISSYFPEDRARVLLVGTFHFDYPGLDALKAAEKDKIDVLKEPKKSEVNELVAYLKKFRPNKIAIEAHPTWEAGRKFSEYRAGEHRNERDERYQLGMRIGHELNLDTIYSVDAVPFSEDLAQVVDSVYMKAIWEEFDFQSDADPYTDIYKEWFEDDSKLVSQISMLEYFKYMNSRESHNYGYGAYLIGDFKLDEYRGADLISIWWYNRNLRIFRKIQQLTEGPEDRILIVIGNGHAAILRQLFEMSPEYEFVELETLGSDQADSP
ncbi:MAG: DUF5694 domain-containing protein [Robiginitalea sp.]